MLRRAHTGAYFVLILIVVLLTTSVVFAQDAKPEPVGLRPDAPTYAVHGPYWVGYKPLAIGEGTERKLDAHIWYPALNLKGEKESITYSIKYKDASDTTNIPRDIYGHALLNAVVDTSGSPYPLIIFSHGFGVNAAWYAPIVEHYTSYGFIVMAVEHIEQFDMNYSDLWKASIDRPHDMIQLLDYAETLTAAGGDMAGLIDMKNIAAAGHSYGGYTALAMAGAQYDLTAYNKRCAALPKDDPAVFLCSPLVDREADMAVRAGLNPMPEGLWPSFGDSRVTAIIPMASDSYMFDKAGLAKITVPMMAIGGTIDTGTPYDWGVKPAYDYASSSRKALVTINNAEHPIFETSCENIPWFATDHPFYQWVCFDPVWDKARATDLINHMTTAFLLDVLKGDKDAHAALAPDAVSFPGIQYEAQGY